jgi:hypothetical protein
MAGSISTKSGQLFSICYVMTRRGNRAQTRGRNLEAGSPNVRSQKTARREAATVCCVNRPFQAYRDVWRFSDARY